MPDTPLPILDILLRVALLVLTPAQMVGAQATDPSGSDLLEMLRANDAQFSNVLVDYDFSQHEVPSQDIPAYMDADEMQTEVEAPNLEPVTTLSRDRLGFRWPDLANRSQIKGSDDYTKFAVVDQRTHFLFSTRSLDLDWIHDSDIDSMFPNVYQEQGKWRQFALGIGFSEIIDTVDSCVRVEDGYQLKVTVDWWSRIQGTGSLLVDSNLVVREASLKLASEEIEVETTGTYKASGRRFACATGGRFKKTKGNRTELEFDILLSSVDFGMTDSTFEKLANMETPQHLARYESEAGQRLVKVRDGTLPPLEWSPWKLALIVFNILIAIVFLARKFIKKSDAQVTK